MADRVLNITIAHDVPGTDLEGVTSRSIAIPPDYDNRDLRAMFAFEVEMTAVQHAQERIGHEAIHKALRAGHSRLARLRVILDGLADSPERAQMLEAFEVSNDTAIARWEERAD